MSELILEGLGQMDEQLWSEWKNHRFLLPLMVWDGEILHLYIGYQMYFVHTCKPLLEERRNPSREFARNPG